MDLDEAREFFKDDIYATEVTGICIDEVRDGFAQSSLTLGNKHRNAAGQVMGGVLFTIADFTFAVAANASDGGLTVSSVSQISFMNPCKGERLIAQARRIKDGRRNCFYQVDVKDELDTLIAVVMATGAHL